jgi:cation diffusion facilitator CzcD-associated flavoprotein CzcO
MHGTQSIEAVIVGAGPYGLSVAAHLKDAGIETRVFGKPMGSWRDHMPRGMYLKSTPAASNLSAPEQGSTLGDYCAVAGGVLDERHPIALDRFVDYGLWFQRRHVKEFHEIEVRQLIAVPGGFRISLSDGDHLTARTVISATGHVSFARFPNELRTNSVDVSPTDAPISHACQHSDFKSLSGKTVAIVGAGQSALESAALLREAGAEAHLLVRGRSIIWGSPPIATSNGGLRSLVKPESPLGLGWSLFVLSRAPELVAYLPASARLFLVRRVLGPSGAWWLRSRFEQRISVMLQTVVEAARVTDGKVSLQLRTAGREKRLEVDHVIAATGYQIDLNALQFLDPALRASVARIGGTSAPRLSRSLESSVPGLYFTGLSAAPTFGPLMRFVCGAEFTARTIRRFLVEARVRNR